MKLHCACAERVPPVACIACTDHTIVHTTHAHRHRTDYRERARRKKAKIVELAILMKSVFLTKLGNFV